MNETNITRLIMMAVSKLNATVFRNNTGMGWQGKVVRTTTRDILIQDPRPLHSGLCTGSSDLIGWTTKEVTPEMVGQKIAIFTAIEVKTGSGRTSKEQLAFIEAIRTSGGISGIARTPEEAQNLIENLK